MALDFKEYIKQLDLNYKAFLNTISVITKEYQNNYKIEEYEVEENTILQVLDLYETKFWKIINTLQGLISIDDSNDVSMLDNIISTNENNYMTVKTFLKRSLDNKKMYIMTSSKLDEIEIFIKKMNVFEGNFNIMQEKLVQYDKQSKTVKKRLNNMLLEVKKSNEHNIAIITLMSSIIIAILGSVDLSSQLLSAIESSDLSWGFLLKLFVVPASIIVISIICLIIALNFILNIKSKNLNIDEINDVDEEYTLDRNEENVEKKQEDK